MQRGRTKRCQVPIRTRRRQSDAKWRASVASCYDTLKFIIPNGKTLPKRKASKALILQETEKHIGNLERAISRLLNIEAQEQGQGVLWRKGDNWSPATLEDMQNDFARQQKNIFHQSTQGRRCYNMLHDIQEEIINLSVDCQNVAFLPLGSTADIKSTKDVATCTRRHRTSRSRCRYETEKAAQRILLAYNTGDQVQAVIPTSTGSQSATITTAYGKDQSQAVPTIPLNTHGSSASTILPVSMHGSVESGTTIKLQKFGNTFVPAEHSYFRDSRGGEVPFQTLSGLDRVIFKYQPENKLTQGIHEVPVTPTRVYGIARNDVMMSQDREAPEMFHTTPILSLPAEGHVCLERETVDNTHSKPSFSSVCKKLDFSTPMSERQFENETSLSLGDNTSYCPSLVCSANTGFTPLKSQSIYSTGELGLTPGKTETTFLSSNNLQTLTPLRLSSDLVMTDTALFSPNSAWTLGSAMDARVPQASLSDLEELADIDGEHSLLCMETFDLDTDTKDSSLKEKTPKTFASPTEHVCKKRLNCKKRCQSRLNNNSSELCSHRPKPKCRKRLDGLYDNIASEEKKGGNSGSAVSGIFDGDAECSDFDGYLLYYQQVIPELRKQLGSSHQADSLAAIVSDMWSQLPNEDRNTMMTLAALENQDSNSSSSGGLSQDLEELNVTPIAGKEFAC